MEKNLPMCMWAKEDLPTYRAESFGIDNLSNAELLSIIVGSGSTHLNAVEFCRLILSECGNNLNTLAQFPNDLLKIQGLGKTKKMKILAALELGRRRAKEGYEEKPDLGTATRIYNHFSHLADLDVEEFWVALMNQNYKLIKEVKISRGGITETPVDIRIIMREACLCNATIIACVHNHPSGRVTPSKCDDDLTRSIKKACELMCYHFLDHVIIGQGQYYSYREMGKV